MDKCNFLSIHIGALYNWDNSALVPKRWSRSLIALEEMGPSGRSLSTSSVLWACVHDHRGRFCTQNIVLKHRRPLLGLPIISLSLSKERIYYNFIIGLTLACCHWILCLKFTWFCCVTSCICNHPTYQTFHRRPSLMLFFLMFFGVFGPLGSLKTATYMLTTPIWRNVLAVKSDFHKAWLKVYR